MQLLLFDYSLHLNKQMTNANVKCSTIADTVIGNTTHDQRKQFVDIGNKRTFTKVILAYGENNYVL